MSISDLDTTTREGKLLIQALTMLSTWVYPQLTPDEILSEVERLQKKVEVP